MDIKNLVVEAEEIIKSDFKVVPERSSYTIHDASSWENILQNTRANKSTQGIFFPRTLTAQLDGESEYLPVNLLHEFFGHGLFCEHSLIGQKIVNQEKELEELEKALLGVEKLPENTILSVGENNPLFPEYVGRADQTKQFLQGVWPTYEGFALWIEYFLASNLGHKDLIEKKLDDRVVVSQQEVDLLEKILEFKKKASRFAVFYSAGMPKYYEAYNLIEMISTMYSKELGDEDLIILNGSRKPYSDIDLFVVSEGIKPYNNEWIDIYSFSPAEVERRIQLLDISVTDPLFSGELIKGSKSKFEKYKERIFGAEITEEAINFNLGKSNKQEEYALSVPEGTRDHRVASRYAHTCRVNAEELKKGNKMLTMQNILKIKN